MEIKIAKSINTDSKIEFKVLPTLIDITKWKGIVQDYISLFEEMINYCLIFVLREKNMSLKKAKRLYTRDRKKTLGPKVQDLKRLANYNDAEKKLFDILVKRRNDLAHPDRLAQKYDTTTDDGKEWMMTFLVKTTLLIVYLTPKVTSTMLKHGINGDIHKMLTKWIQISDEIFDLQNDFSGILELESYKSIVKMMNESLR